MVSAPDPLFPGARREKKNVPKQTHLAGRGFGMELWEGLQ
jgi:hypothetical protein